MTRELGFYHPKDCPILILFLTGTKADGEGTIFNYNKYWVIGRSDLGIIQMCCILTENGMTHNLICVHFNLSPPNS